MFPKLLFCELFLVIMRLIRNASNWHLYGFDTATVFHLTCTEWPLNRGTWQTAWVYLLISNRCFSYSESLICLSDSFTNRRMVVDSPEDLFLVPTPKQTNSVTSERRRCFWQLCVNSSSATNTKSPMNEIIEIKEFRREIKSLILLDLSGRFTVVP